MMVTVMVMNYYERHHGIPFKIGEGGSANEVCGQLW